MARIRVKKIESLIQEEAARFITTELADPRLGFVTVTKVECTGDLSLARIFVSILGTEPQQRTSLRALEDAAGGVRTRVGRGLGIRRVPELEFVHDVSAEKSIRMSELIREARAGDPDGGLSPEPPAPDPSHPSYEPEPDEPEPTDE